MGQISSVFRRFIPQLLHILILPVFFFTFLLLYRPYDATVLVGGSNYGVHITLLSCIILLAILLSRLLYYFLPLKLNYSLYIFWCVAEMIFMSFFDALYVWLALSAESPYLEVLTSTFTLIFMTLVIPYSILALSLRNYEYHQQSQYINELPSARKMRFYDSKHNLKLLVSSDAILFIAAEENYVNINYLENSKLCACVLRSSMKAIENLCTDNGLVRCHRSYYINPMHIKVLRKDSDGFFKAELDNNDAPHIPVTKRYYRALADLL